MVSLLIPWTFRRLHRWRDTLPFSVCRLRNTFLFSVGTSKAPVFSQRFPGCDLFYCRVPFMHRAVILLFSPPSRIFFLRFRSHFSFLFHALRHGFVPITSLSWTAPSFRTERYLFFLSHGRRDRGFLQHGALFFMRRLVDFHVEDLSLADELAQYSSPLLERSFSAAAPFFFFVAQLRAV